jgi:hypothetical protein
MSAPKKSVGELLPGPAGETLEEVVASDPDAIVVTRYFVAANVILSGRNHALLALSPYFGTLAGAERELETLRDEYPNAVVLFTHSRYNIDSPAQMAELEEVTAQAGAEMRKEGYQ